MSLTVLLYALRENGDCILGDGVDECIKSLEYAIQAICRAKKVISEPNPAIIDTIWVDEYTTLYDLLDGAR